MTHKQPITVDALTADADQREAAAWNRGWAAGRGIPTPGPHRTRREKQDRTPADQITDAMARGAAAGLAALKSATPEPAPTRRCAHPACQRGYQADTGPAEPGWTRLRGLTVLCPDHPIAATADPTNTPKETP